MAKAAPLPEFKVGQRVKVIQHGPIRIGRLVLEDNTFIGAVIARRNDDGSYQVKGLVKTPESDEVRIPADWIETI